MKGPVGMAGGIISHEYSPHKTHVASELKSQVRNKHI